MKRNMILKPPPLKQGDCVGVIAPSSPVKEPFRSQGLAKIRELGLTPVEAPNILASDYFRAKSPEESFADLQRFFDAPEIKAIWAARGGYGANYLLPLLSRLRVTSAKMVIGSSDVSYLLWSLLENANLTVFYGPMAYSSLPENRVNLENFWTIASGAHQRLEFPGKVLIPGKCSGPLTGGCLTNLVSLLGTHYFPRLLRRVVLLEDTGERPYRLDRMFWQLEQKGVFSRIAGLALGQFPGCFNDEDERNHFFKNLVQRLTPYGFPVVHDVPLGHGNNLHMAPLGVPTEINSEISDGLILLAPGVDETAP